MKWRRELKMRVGSDEGVFVLYVGVLQVQGKEIEEDSV